MGTKEENKVCAVEEPREEAVVNELVERERSGGILAIRLKTADSSPATLMSLLQEPLTLLNGLDFNFGDAHGISHKALQEMADELMAEVDTVIGHWIYARAQESCSIIEGIFDSHGIDALIEYDEETNAIVVGINFDHIVVRGEDEED